jgi:hypothetical protein
MFLRAVLAVTFAALALLFVPSQAVAQTLIPDVPDVLGGGDEDGPGPSADGSERCLPGASLLCAADDLGAGASEILGGTIGAGAEFAADAALSGMAGWAAAGAAWLVRSAVAQVDRSTRPALGSAWFSRQYSAMRNTAILLSVLFLLIAIAQAVVRRDMAMLLRSSFVALPLALLLTFAAVTLVELGVALTDELTAAALRSSGTDVKEAFADLSEVLTAGASPIPGFVMFLGTILTAVLATIVWIELILREAAIYVAVAFLPITLSAFVWPRTAHWARRLTEWLAAIVLAKFTIAASFAIAGSMLAHGRGGSGGWTAILGGCAVLLVAALSPWVLLRLIPFAEQAAGAFHRSHVRGAVRTAPGAAATSLLVRQAMIKNFGASMSSAGGSRPRAWAPKPPRPPAAAESRDR